MINFKQMLVDINTFVFDVDGVLASAIVSTLANGEQIRTMNAKDGYAIQLAIKNGFNICIISGAKSDSIKMRFEKLGVKNIYMESHNKLETFEKYIKEKNLDTKEILYMGDDIPDYKPMKIVGVPVCPLDAVEEIKSISKYISHAKGGEGCVRDIIEQVLKIQGKWMNENAFCW